LHMEADLILIDVGLHFIVVWMTISSYCWESRRAWLPYICIILVKGL
jgi:hypothetical protein